MYQNISGFFQKLQLEICDCCLKIEKIANQDVQHEFHEHTWKRDNNPSNGGGTSMVLRGNVFEKAGINFSDVCGKFQDAFSNEIPGAKENNGVFQATGISLVMHPRNPHIPIIHMNLRHICTSKAWFGGGIDLTPSIEYQEDTEYFHHELEIICGDRYMEFKKWCDKYFYIQHRQEARGIGGVFFDYLDANEDNLHFVQSLGRKFMNIYSEIVQRHINTTWDDNDLISQKNKRAKYVEFNLLYDRGTRFGLKTGANLDALFVSLPPSTGW